MHSRASFLFLATLAACAHPRVAVTPSSVVANPASATGDSGWISLFDGTTLRGWRGLGSSVAPSQWVVESGALH